MNSGSRLLWLTLVLAAVFAVAALLGEFWVQHALQSPGTPLERLQLIHERYFVAMLLLAGGLFCIPVILILARRLQPPEPGSAAQERAAISRRELDPLVSIARTAVMQGEQLDAARLKTARMEEDLAFNRQLLQRALEEKLQLGRDLHDGLIQSLYAAGLTLEAARARVESDPKEAAAGISQSVDLLNRGIRELRGYLEGLGPEALRAYGFKAALQASASELKAASPAAVAIVVDDHAVGRLSLEQARELHQIAREGLSNALRHASAAAITLRLSLDERGAVRLEVVDDGRGFDPSKVPGGGRGLRNLRARAEALGAGFSLDSRPGSGTRICLELPPE